MLNAKDFEMPLLDVEGYQGVLVIGDPMLGPHKRLGRSDDVWQAGMAKLGHALDIAQELNLLPFLVGDVLHDARDIGQLVPLIQILRGRDVILLPRNNLWGQQAQGHLAAVLLASGVAQVAGYGNSGVRVLSHGEVQLTLTVDAAWGGKERLGPGERARVEAIEAGVFVGVGSRLPVVVEQDGFTTLEAGRLIRVRQDEEEEQIQVFAVTGEGVEPIELERTPVVFVAGASSSLEETIERNRDSLFVDSLRRSTQDALEDEGKNGLMDMIDGVLKDGEADEWLQGTILSLAKQAVSDAA